MTFISSFNGIITFVRTIVTMTFPSLRNRIWAAPFSRVTAAAIAAMVIPAAASAQTVLRVDIENDILFSQQDGTTWSTAYRFLQDALTDAAANANASNPYEIWVRQGAYRPDQKDANGPSAPCPPYGDCSRTASFNLRNNVGIFGGFDGTESERSDRRPLENITILSGALKCEDPIGSPCTPAPAGQDNSRRIVVSENNSATARLDGFHIAEARYQVVNIDAALHMVDSNAIISNCVIRDNINMSPVRIQSEIPANLHAPQLINCVVHDNTVDPNAFFSGVGGVWVSGLGVHAVLMNCLIYNNSGLDAGGVLTSGSNAGERRAVED